MKQLLASLFFLAVAATSSAQTEQLFERLSPSVVSVEAHSQSGQRINQGSGVVISRSEVVTNCHVIAYRSKVTVVGVGGRARASLDRGVWTWDLCVLRVEAELLSPVQAVSGKSPQLKVGQRVLAIGSPQGMSNTLSDGLISGFRQLRGSTNLIQTSTPISQGSSGGGLFNFKGELIGITSLTLSSGQNINFAIPASLIAELPDSPVDYALATEELTELALIELLEAERYADARAVVNALVKRHPQRHHYRLYQALAHEDPVDRIGALLELEKNAAKFLSRAYPSLLLASVLKAQSRGSSEARHMFSDQDLRLMGGVSKANVDDFLKERDMDAPIWLEYALRDSLLLRVADKNAIVYLDELQSSRLRRAPESCYLRWQLLFRRELLELSPESLGEVVELAKKCSESPSLLAHILLRLNKIEGADEQFMAQVAYRLGELSPSRWELLAPSIVPASVRTAGDSGAARR